MVAIASSSADRLAGSSRLEQPLVHRLDVAAEQLDHAKHDVAALDRESDRAGQPLAGGPFLPAEVVVVGQAHDPGRGRALPDPAGQTLTPAQGEVAPDRLGVGHGKGRGRPGRQAAQTLPLRLPEEGQLPAQLPPDGADDLLQGLGDGQWPGQDARDGELQAQELFGAPVARDVQQDAAERPGRAALPALGGEEIAHPDGPPVRRDQAIFRLEPRRGGPAIGRGLAAGGDGPVSILGMKPGGPEVGVGQPPFAGVAKEGLGVRADEGESPREGIRGPENRSQAVRVDEMRRTLFRLFQGARHHRFASTAPATNDSH